MRFHDVQLEVVRPGPPHNQPLNELTQYLALCGENSPITFNVPFEHAELLSRLEHLRYFVPSTRGQMVRIAGAIRENTLARLGAEVGTLLGTIRSLGTELASVRPENWGANAGETQVAHLRLVLSGSELAIVPFELSIAPDAMPGEGQELFLQSRIQIVPTREIRRSRPLSTRISHFNHPKVLFAFAAPGMDVPAVDHLHAIRCALDPWIGQTTGLDGDVGVDRTDTVKEWLRVLPNASLRSISALCEQEHFSHVHILAHGDAFTEAGQTRWGIALCHEDDRTTKHVVSGKRLAHALTVEAADGNSRSAPFWVTLATCDSGNPGSVMVPGGSIAHDLHTSGIPWVLASQFPLTKRGSVEVTRLLYDRLFAGDDPRQALYETRKRLYTHAERNHDWASMVTYASIPPDFDANVAGFFERVTESAIDKAMSDIDELFKLGQLTEEDAATLGQLLDQEFDRVQALLDRWEYRLPTGMSAAAKRSRTNFHGMSGSVTKRLALHKASSVVLSETGSTSALQAARRLLLDANTSYRRATDEWAFDDNLFNWVAGQYLSTSLVLGKAWADEETATILRASIRRQRSSDHPDDLAWALCAEIELILLDFINENLEDKGQVAWAPVRDQIATMVDTIADAVGRDGFHFESTRRQFVRYQDNFSGLADFPTYVRELAGAVAVLFET